MTSACGDTSVVISVVFLGEGERDKLNCFSFIKFKIYFIALILYYYILFIRLQNMSSLLKKISFNYGLLNGKRHFKIKYL